MNEICVDLLKALFATLVVEEIATLFWRERSARLAAVVSAANAATNPALNVALIACDDWVYATRLREATAIGVGECGVLLAETAIFWRFGRLAPKRAFFFAASLNSASFLAGYPLSALGYWN